MRFLGAGLACQSAQHDALLHAENGPDVLEVSPEDFYAHPAALEALAERYPLAFHGVGLSVGTASSDPLGDEVARARLGRLRELVRRVEPLYVSDPLAFTRAPNGIELGHPCPLPYTDETYQLVSVRVSAWQDRLEVPLLLENIAHPFFWVGNEMNVGAFFDRLTRETDCGLLLDLTSVLYDARNFRRSPGQLLNEYPLGQVRAVHLAGGTHSSRDHFWSDTHDQPVDPEVFGMLAALRGYPNLQAAIIERQRRLPALADLMIECRHAVEILTG